MDGRIDIAWAEDDPVFTVLMLNYLNSEGNGSINVLFTTPNGKELLNNLEGTDNLPHIILLDIRMPLMNGIQTARILKDKYPDIKIIAFTDFDFEDNIVEMNIVGVKSFIAKSQSTDLIRAISIVHGGGIFFPDKVGDILQQYITRVNTIKTTDYFFNSELKIALTPQERRLLEFLKLGKTSKEIASQMNLTIKTVRTYRERLLKKTKTRNVAELLNRCF